MHLLSLLLAGVWTSHALFRVPAPLIVCVSADAWQVPGRGGLSGNTGLVVFVARSLGVAADNDVT